MNVVGNVDMAVLVNTAGYSGTTDCLPSSRYLLVLFQYFLTLELFFLDYALFPVIPKSFVIFLDEQGLLKCKFLAKCLAAGTVEQILWVQRAGGNGSAGIPMLVGSKGISVFVMLQGAGKYL